MLKEQARCTSGPTFPIRFEGRGGLQGYDMWKFPHCLGNRLTDDGEFIIPTHRPLSTSQKCYFSPSSTHIFVSG
jgi:hypothetical protein